MQLDINEPADKSPRFALFALGFRPFFLFAALFSCVLMFVWIASGAGQGAPQGKSVLWHSHEMLFGYTVAVIAGFLLTAVKNWTGQQTLHGVPLLLLSGLWLAGRVAMLLYPQIHNIVPAIVDIGFLLVLTIAVMLPIVRVRQWHNLLFVPILLALLLADVLVHLDLAGITATSRLGIYLALDLILLLIVIMAGRVVPFFIERAVPGASLRRWKAVEVLAVVTMLGFIVTDLLSLPDKLVFAIAMLALLVHAMRLVGWHARGLWSLPMLWVLFLGYGWLVAGFLLRTLDAAGMHTGLLAVHAFTAGTIGVLTLGMMARVALGHTGRGIHAPPLIIMAFILVNLAALLRVTGPLLLPQYYPALMTISGSLWIMAFALFCLRYVPILLMSRIDGRPG
jgi:uncharacterized protein involved in response to NO